MTHHWDEFSKSLAQPLPRRESLRRLGIALAGAVLSPLGLQTASAGHHPKQQQDPCKSFCKCRSKKQQNACLAACKACGNDPRFLCGSCSGGYACTDLANDPYNCGACGSACDQAGSYEYGVCVSGECDYFCIEGADRCDGTCTLLGGDPFNCGACGNVCPETAPYCNQGECAACPPGTALCGGQCVDLLTDPSNCGGCGIHCADSEACISGFCESGGACPEGQVRDDLGVCCDPGCTPDNPYYPNCGTVCGDPCLTFWTGLTWCNPTCVGLQSDPYNCGACGNVCPDGFVCSSGACWDPICQFVEC
jgi:hypothetical protein